MSNVVKLPVKSDLEIKAVDWRDELGAARAQTLPRSPTDVMRVGGATMASYAVTARLTVAEMKIIHQGAWDAFEQTMALYGLG